ncbi:hypothetical protein [Algoriphagus sp. A40]|uniref:hypothetical protein n=1 Tax=Algoriphagus sp. A40 TaxID=1945863 RepID=UPI000984B59D|nr:hypothetical protein [Algoriphagus sp. A40]OOG76490.1 hypothetical protein B0E43_08365 [Algoriphagus sp. A40]
MGFKTLLVIASLIFYSCTNTKSKNLESARNDQAKGLSDVLLVNCNGEEYRLEVDYYQESKSKYVSIFNENKLFKEVNLPSQLDYSGFSLNGFLKTEKGFVVSVEYGSVNYFQKEFFFQCKQDGFILYKIRTTSFNKRNPSKEFVLDSILSSPMALKDFRFIPFLE